MIAIKNEVLDSCKPLLSQREKYVFKRNINLITLIKELKTKGYETKKQILNFSGKVIGVIASNKSGKSIEIGNKIFDFQRLELYHGNHLIKLTYLEASLLNFFALNPGKIISREMVINGLDLSQGRQDLNKRNVDVQITRLRKKIEPDPTNPRYLKTIRGRGYRFLP